VFGYVLDVMVRTRRRVFSPPKNLESVGQRADWLAVHPPV
jgi:hypothetical protein